MPRVKTVKNQYTDIPIKASDDFILKTLNAYDRPFAYRTGVSFPIAEGERYVVFMDKDFVKQSFVRLAGGIMGLYPCDSDSEVVLPLENVARMPQMVSKGTVIAHAVKIT